MTYHGTNSYLIPSGSGYWLLDPGPTGDETHVDDLLRVSGGRIAGIVLTHGHHDHCGAIQALRAKIDAPLYAYHAPIPGAPIPDIALKDGDDAGPLKAIYTPGHSPDHLCFAWTGGILLSGDHVMGWSSTVVSPPRGDMGSYIASLKVMILREDRVYLPGHGPALHNPRDYVRELRRRRVQREEQILAALHTGSMTAKALSAKLYSKLDPVLQDAAARNVISHLQKLQREGKAQEMSGEWRAST